MVVVHAFQRCGSPEDTASERQLKMDALQVYQHMLEEREQRSGAVPHCLSLFAEDTLRVRREQQLVEVEVAAEAAPQARVSARAFWLLLTGRGAAFRTRRTARCCRSCGLSCKCRLETSGRFDERLCVAHLSQRAQNFVDGMIRESSLRRAIDYYCELRKEGVRTERVRGARRSIDRCMSLTCGRMRRTISSGPGSECCHRRIVHSDGRMGCRRGKYLTRRDAPAGPPPGLAAGLTSLA